MVDATTPLSSVESTAVSQTGTGAGASYVQVETSVPPTLGLVIFVQTANAFTNKSVSAYSYIN